MTYKKKELIQKEKYYQDMVDFFKKTRELKNLIKDSINERAFFDQLKSKGKRNGNNGGPR